MCQGQLKLLFCITDMHAVLNNTLLYGSPECCGMFRSLWMGFPNIWGSVILYSDHCEN